MEKNYGYTSAITQFLWYVLHADWPVMFLPVDATVQWVSSELSSCSSSDAIQCWSGHQVLQWPCQWFESGAASHPSCWARALASWRHSGGRLGRQKQMPRYRPEVRCFLPRRSLSSSFADQPASEILWQMDLKKFKKREKGWISVNYICITRTNVLTKMLPIPLLELKGIKLELGFAWKKSQSKNRNGTRIWTKTVWKMGLAPFGMGNGN